MNVSSKCLVNRTATHCFVTIALSILLFVPPSAMAHGFPPDEGLALAIEKSLQQTLARVHILDESDRLNVTAARIVQIDDLGFIAYAVKLLDRQNDTIYTYWYDNNVQPISEEAAVQARALAYEAKYGHLSRSLHARLTQVSIIDPVPVAIWAEQGPGSDVPPSSLPITIYLPMILRDDGSSCGTPMECIVQFVETHGYTVDYISAEVPIVYADLPVSVIDDLQGQPYVAAIYEQADNQNTLYSAGRTAAAPWTWSRGITGSGIKVAVLEVPDRCGTGSSGVVANNPYVSAFAYYDDSEREGSHATMVAGVIASVHPTDRGIANGTAIISANAEKAHERHAIAAADWAIRADADIINVSFGAACGNRSITSQDKYFDWVVWKKQKTVVVAAGNLSSNPNKPSYCPSNAPWSYCPSNYNVTSPGKAYNVVTVGAKDDQNTAATEADTLDDQFSYFSLYVDPDTASSNRLKPEVVAVGERINTTIGQSPWIGEEAAGTSFSTPIVAGEAALMMQRANWLKHSPEAVKAGIMATAKWTFLHDDQNWDSWTSVEKMGVGAIDTTAADNSLINNRIQGLYLRKSSFTNDAYDIYFDGIADQRIRVVITWSSHPSRIWITNWILHDRLESDFDLTIRAPDGQIFGSYADEANYEIVEFVAPQSGSYRARIHLSRWDDSSMEERMGFAWYSGFPLP